MTASPDAPPPADLADEIAALIAAEGPIPLGRFMGLANAHYYATRDPFGAGGDFVTAPEISQMFGEIVGLCLADLWQRAGTPKAAYVELGPGRGTLAVDALRAMAKAEFAPPVHFVETSPILRDAQRERVEQAIWHDTIETLPKDVPLLIVANEFFDALPVHQLIATVSGWREQMVEGVAGDFSFVPGTKLMDSLIPQHLWDADPGRIVEQNPAAIAIVTALAHRLAKQGGALLIVDYGHDGSRHGDTLQAVHAHAYADPLVKPGQSDLTAHVDFLALEAAATAAGARVFGPVEQGQWLIALGISDRAGALTRQARDRGNEIAAAYRRLTHPDEMGSLFKALAVVSPKWPEPAGFA
ncbi:SAM-dependent methyltransferase [Sphingomonas sp. BIUV-7]|uniref:SAM-dependent methyltransferase n=1 Tax=Sphingomonas natans TaxID=3063330 RepID=A0ABT8YFQ0_9SPHN|nr:SAM-dependent methyltransferase [Sphingomonas sp. BIUV-7]MDO6416728.1 SAM-dependent methyltransferase [Sphingomonas sp. BIUV-7]